VLRAVESVSGPSECGQSLEATITPAVLPRLARLGDVIRRREDGAFELSDPVMALWLGWRAPGGAAVPMGVLGDEGERHVAPVPGGAGLRVVYQSKASRGPSISSPFAPA
jgi:hypothetical protein